MSPRRTYLERDGMLCEMRTDLPLIKFSISQTYVRRAVTRSPQKLQLSYSHSAYRREERLQLQNSRPHDHKTWKISCFPREARVPVNA